MRKTWKQKLYALGACAQARRWIRGQEGSYLRAWKTCPEHYWMLWLLDHAREEYTAAANRTYRMMMQERITFLNAHHFADAALAGAADIVRRYYPKPPKLPS